MNLQDRMDVKETVERFRPHLLINTAALLPAKLCEDNPTLARAINIEGVGYLCEAAKVVGAKVVHISTDWVFSGVRKLYREDDSPDPINEYGRSKMSSERIMQKTGIDHCIIRTSMIYGWNLRPDKFNYFEMGLESLARGEEFSAPDDQYFAPILANSLAEAMFEIYAEGITGVLHVTGPDVCSRYDFSRAAAGVFGLNPNLVKPVSLSEEYFGVKAPRYLSLDLTKAKTMLMTVLPGIREGLLEAKHLQESGYVARLRSGGE